MTSCKKSEVTCRINAINDCKALIDLHEILEFDNSMDIDDLVSSMSRTNRKIVKLEVARIRHGLNTCFQYIDSNMSSTEFISMLSTGVAELQYLFNREKRLLCVE